MSKLIIEQALQQAIAANNLHLTTLHGGNVNLFVVTLSNHIPFCHPRVLFQNLYGRNVRISNITYTNNQCMNVDWAQQASHFSPHQYANLQTYLNYSLQGPLQNVFKLLDCGFDKFYLLQLQSHVTQFNLLGGATYQQLQNATPFFSYLSRNNSVAANANINNVVIQNRIQQLELESRAKIDANLICGHMPNTILGPFANIDVTIHYLISGPFDRHTLINRLTVPHPNNPNPLNPALPFEDQIGNRNQPTIWDIDVSIASDVEE